MKTQKQLKFPWFEEDSLSEKRRLWLKHMKEKSVDATFRLRFDKN